MAELLGRLSKPIIRSLYHTQFSITVIHMLHCTAKFFSGKKVKWGSLCLLVWVVRSLNFKGGGWAAQTVGGAPGLLHPPHHIWSEARITKKSYKKKDTLWQMWEWVKKLTNGTKQTSVNFGTLILIVCINVMNVIIKAISTLTILHKSSSPVSEGLGR